MRDSASLVAELREGVGRPARGGGCALAVDFEYSQGIDNSNGDQIT